MSSCTISHHGQGSSTVRKRTSNEGIDRRELTGESLDSCDIEPMCLAQPDSAVGRARHGRARLLEPPGQCLQCPHLLLECRPHPEGLRGDHRNVRQRASFHFGTSCPRTATIGGCR